MDASASDDVLNFSDPHHHVNYYDDVSISAPNDTLNPSSYNYHQFPPPPSTVDDSYPHFLSSPPGPPPFSSDFTDCLCSIPSADVEELEWLSKFVDDSFTDYHDDDGGASLMLTSTTTTRVAYSAQNQNASSFIKSGDNNKSILMQPQHHTRFTPTSTVTTMTTSSNETDKSSSSSKSYSRRHYNYSASPISARSSGGGEISSSSSTRRCTHCASEKTPQWRSGPLGPKSLCNACGVRYKSGRLVPEYRPAASPTFVLTQHSNSHRKVLELRRQKQISQSQEQQVAYRQPDFEVC